MVLLKQFENFDTFFLIYVCFITVVIGLVMGSFLNCTAIRIVTGEPISRGRSHCMDCGHTLGIADLVPLFSWLSLRGRCRYCGEKIPARYPLSELAAAAAYISVIFMYGITNEGFEMLILFSFLMIIAFCDIEDYLIPDRFILAGIILRIVYIFTAVFYPDGDWIGEPIECRSPIEILNELGFQSLLGGLAVSVPLLILVLIMEKAFHRDFMGGGDIKLLFMIGIFFTWKINLFSIMVSCILGIIGGILLNKKGILEIPFGPFIIAGSWIGMLVGRQVTDFYFGLF